MEYPRASGILLHPTSLPGPYGIGDIGPEAKSFIRLLKEAGQKYWQILPLGPTGYGDSPYQCFSAFAGNTLLISPDVLLENGLVGRKHLDSRPEFADGRADYGGVHTWKNELLRTAYSTFTKGSNKALRDEFAKFKDERSYWLDDYALFRAIRSSKNQSAWFEWDPPLRQRERGALSLITDTLREEIEYEKFTQFLFFRQWLDLKEAAQEAEVLIVGDIPMFVALDSADVWCSQDKFKLKTDGRPEFVAGVPPDYFSADGQLWGNPVYDWDAVAADGFRWWIDRVNHTLEMVDIARIDHFRGFVSAWEVPASDTNARGGKWVEGAGAKLFSALRTARDGLPLWAEDLGEITPEVEKLRDDFGFPGMKILQYAFGGDPQNGYLPHNFTRNCIVYTGTHDNDTSAGWFASLPTGGERDYCLRYLDSDGSEIHWDLIRSAHSSVADTVIVPMQDILGLGSDSRMNLPASASGNWQWRLRPDSPLEPAFELLKEVTATYGR